MALSNTLSAITREKFMPVLVDNIFNSNVLCLKLLKNADKLDGGVKINVPLEVTQNSGTNSGWLAAGGIGATGQALADVADKAVYDWATSYNSIIISSDEQHINMGSNQVLSLLKAKLSNAEKTLKDLFGTSMFAVSTASNFLTTLNGTGTYDGGGGGSSAATAKEHDNGNGLIHDASTWTGSDAYFIPEGAVAESIIGYDRSLAGITSATAGTNDYWNANTGSFCWAIGQVIGSAAALNVNGSDDFQTTTFTKFCTTTSGVANGIKAMTQMYGACSVDADQPDLIITTQVIYDAYETALQANKRWVGDAAIGDAGFQSLGFKGASVVVDSHCPAGQMYFLNTKYLDFKCHAKRFFAYEDFKPMEAKDGIQSRIFWMGELVTSNPRMQGVLVGGPLGY